jgi:membrane-bound lytic murein transglycosylase D
MTDIPPAVIRITLPDGTTSNFTQQFTIGRHSECAVCITDGVVSRRHADVFQEDGQWWIQDLQSANGVYVDGRRVDRAVLSGSGQIQLGAGGPTFYFHVELPVPESPEPQPSFQTPSPEHLASPPPSGDSHDLDHYKDHYFGKTVDQTAGEHTMMVRRAFAEVQKKQRRFYSVIIGCVVVLLLITGAVALYNHTQVAKQRQLAADIFYTMRELEIDLVRLNAEAQKRQSREDIQRIEAAKAKKKRLEENYDRYVSALDVYRKGLSPQERLILKMARTFGECEINMPDGFVDEVTRYIAMWQSGQRLQNVIRSARQKGYVSKIVNAMETHDLPPQFFYLGVQESNLNHNAVGPPTRFGIAKGMWQFIPQTAEKYGLRTGPLKDEAVVDLLDERHNFAKSTQAAASYLRDIYTTDAQASGLLVMASYNWGERRIIKLIQSMPANPRERNFWELILKYRPQIPDETYDYVFSIFSAAVIGENPRLFGFDFDNPLGSSSEQGNTTHTIQGPVGLQGNPG